KQQFNLRAREMAVVVQASRLPSPGVSPAVVLSASGFAGETPGARGGTPALLPLQARFVAFTAQTRMSGVDFPVLDGQPERSIRKGAADAMRVYIDQLGGTFPQAVGQSVDEIS